MFQLGKTIVSEDIIAKDFVCNLNACKGACEVSRQSTLTLLEAFFYGHWPPSTVEVTKFVHVVFV